jgi:oligoendopeptidase F
MTGAGVADDVTTLVHEAGHAFHSFEAFALPFVFQRDPGAEMAEVASMAMELLAAPYLGRERGGFYGEADLRRARAEHLDLVLRLLAGVAMGDAFQTWIYTSGRGHDAAARDEAWRELGDRFDPGIDWGGLDAERTAAWHATLHFFMVPFYFIEYGVAQLAALQIWRASLGDEAGALAAYRRALALGGTRPLPELYAAAGARLAFDAGTMAELVGAVEAELAELDA